MNFRSLRLLSSSVALAVAGCTVGPNYKRPEVETPVTFTEPLPSTTQPVPTTAPTTGPATSAAAATTQPVELAQWWKSFDDPLMNQLMTEAMRSSLDLQLATARLREARFQRGVISSQYYPQLDAQGSYTHNRSSQNAFSIGTSPGSGTGTTTGGSTGAAFGSGARDTDLFQAGFDADWELDVFGGTRRGIEAATADIQAAIEDRRDVLVSLLSEVGRNYIELRSAQRRYTVAQNNLNAQKETLELTRSRFKAGLISELDVARARAQVATTASELPTLETEIRQTIHRLSVLLGKEPGTLSAELTPPGNVPAVVPIVPVGLPSDLLRRRPDIRRAERQLAAATARIGEATADYFPKFSLTGSIGQQSQKATKFFDEGSTFWSFGPGISWSAFNAGRVRSNIGVQNELQRQALISYQSVILSSMEEVEDALIAYDREQSRRLELAEAVAANRRAVDLANQLYDRGLVDFLNVLNAQQALFLSEDQLVQSDAAVSSNLVALYKALGGGWDSTNAK
jgi:NodT family efflux transporter outer membrane factor (OMF) lipoprotein